MCVCIYIYRYIYRYIYIYIIYIDIIYIYIYILVSHDSHVGSDLPSLYVRVSLAVESSVLNFNVLYFCYSIHLFPCTDLSNLIYLPILVHIINVTTSFKEYYLLIYLFSI